MDSSWAACAFVIQRSVLWFGLSQSKELWPLSSVLFSTSSNWSGDVPREEIAAKPTARGRMDGSGQLGPCDECCDGCPLTHLQRIGGCLSPFEVNFACSRSHFQSNRD
jgi:hypothetical protein